MPTSLSQTNMTVQPDSPLSENSSSSTLSWRIPAVDGFRALAMLMVIACHSWEFGHEPKLYLAPLGVPVEFFGFFKCGSYGVDLFMVLSGFCLFLPLCKSEQALARFQWKTFYMRRARRIIPPYYAGIAFTTFIPFALVAFFRLIHIKANWQPLPGTVTDYLAVMLFSQNFFMKTFGSVNASYWSMGLEAQFYLMFPLVVWMYRRIRLRGIALVFGISILYNIFMESYTTGMAPRLAHLYFIFFPGRWIQFAAGMLAAWIVAHHRRQDMWRDSKWGTLGVLAALAVYTFTASVDFPRFFGWVNPALMAFTFALVLVSVCVTRSPLGRLFSNRVMERLGLISYSIFLVHWPVVYFFSQLLERLHVHGRLVFFALFPGGVLASVVVGYVFFRLFERPFLNPPTPARKEAAEALA